MGKFTKDKRDIYYRKAKEDGFRARSAYKLIQIDEEYDIFENVERVIDLCAAPGSWSQVIARKLSEKGLFKQNKKEENEEEIENRIISVDLQEMAGIDNTVQIVGDITKQSTVDLILQKFKNKKAQLVVCDGAPDVTGIHDIDQYIQSSLIVAALNITNLTLQTNGSFVAKVFLGNDQEFLEAQFRYFFKRVEFIKPKSSRLTSVENFIVCLNYQPPQSYIPSKLSTFENIENTQKDHDDQQNQSSQLFKFITQGDLSGFDL